MSTPEVAEGRSVALTIPAHADYLVLARLALSAVSRLTPLSADDVADLKLAVTEAAADFVTTGAETSADSELELSLVLRDDRLVLELSGEKQESADPEQELGRAIIEATVDEADFLPDMTRLVKRLDPS